LNSSNNLEIIQLEEEKLKLVELINDIEDVHKIKELIYEYKNTKFINSLNNTNHSFEFVNNLSFFDNSSFIEHCAPLIKTETSVNTPLSVKQINEHNNLIVDDNRKQDIKIAYDTLKSIIPTFNNNIISMVNKQYNFTYDIIKNIKILSNNTLHYKIVYNNDKYYFKYADVNVNCYQEKIKVKINNITLNINLNHMCDENIEKYNLVSKNMMFDIIDTTTKLNIFRYTYHNINFKKVKSQKKDKIVKIFFADGYIFSPDDIDIIYRIDKLKYKFYLNKNNIQIMINNKEFKFFQIYYCRENMLDSKINRTFTSYINNLKFDIRDNNFLIVKIPDNINPKHKIIFQKPLHKESYYNIPYNITFNTFLDVIYHIYDFYNIYNNATC
jgi:hypothetical protein